MDFNACAKMSQKYHAGQMREGGLPYFYHPLAVAEILKGKGFPVEFQIVGLFHDLLEDTICSEKEILEHSSIEVLEAVKLLTKQGNQSMEDYMNQIMNNEMARMVKLADRIHNLSTLDACSKEKMQRKLDETDKYFIVMARDTVFEEDILAAATGSQRIVNDRLGIPVHRSRR